MATLAVLAEARYGILQRLLGLLDRRGFVLRSLAVGAAAEPGTVRLTLGLEGDAGVAERARRVLLRVVDVLEAEVIPEERSVRRELALIKVSVSGERRAALLHVAEIFRGRLVDVGPRSAVLEVVGDPEKIDACLGLLEEFGVLEVARTGPVAVERGLRALGAVPAAVERAEAPGGPGADRKPPVLTSVRG